MIMRASRRNAAAHGDAFTPPPQLHTLINNSFWFADNPLLIEDPEGNKVRSVDSPHSSRIHHTLVERSRGARETRLRPDAHGVAPRAPCRGQARQRTGAARQPGRRARGGRGRESERGVRPGDARARRRQSPTYHRRATAHRHAPAASTHDATRAL